MRFGEWRGRFDVAEVEAGELGETGGELGGIGCGDLAEVGEHVTF